MGLYDRLRDERIGQQAQVQAQAQQQGQQMAQQELANAQAQQEQAMMQQQQQQVMQDQAFNQGQQVGQRQGAIQQNNEMLSNRLAEAMGGQQRGLGIGQQTVQEIQNQDTMKQQQMQQYAQEILGSIEQARQQGAPESHIQKMYESIPPEMKGAVGALQKQMQMQQMQQAAQAQQGGNIQQGY